MLGENIRIQRKLRRITQVEMALALGVSKQSVCNWENNNIMPSIQMLVNIASYFGVSTDLLLGLGGESAIETDGLTAAQVEHIRLLVSDLRASNLSAAENFAEAE